jgi:two-component system CheB/CheR fusion protein
MANQTSRETGSVDEFRESFIGRIEALGQAHALLLATQWQSADLGKLVESALRTYDGNAIITEGPPVRLIPKQGLGLALMLHELATNAAKYGALSVPDGRLSVNWSEEAGTSGRTIHLQWQESDGPAVEGPRKKGFGVKLLERACRFELQGEVELKFEPAGFIAAITFPLA